MDYCHSCLTYGMLCQSGRGSLCFIHINHISVEFANRALLNLLDSLGMLKFSARIIPVEWTYRIASTPSMLWSILRKVLLHAPYLVEME